MRAYGLPRNDDVANPDVADARLYGRPTRIAGRVRNRAAARRIWKKTARRDARRDVSNRVSD